MHKRFAVPALALLLAAALLLPVRSSASPVSDEDRKVLEESLSIVELDREIERIEAERKTAENSLLQLEGELEIKQEQIQASREQAGKRIAAYYMGERETLLSALLSASSLQDFFTVLDYYQLIAERDRHILNTYKSEYASLKNTKDGLKALASELAQTEERLKRKRDRVAELELRVDGALEASSDPEKLSAMIDELTGYWQNAGLSEVRRHFRELASVMADFPDFLKEYQESLTSSKEGYRLTIRQEDLNRFLHARSELLKNMTFSFENGKIAVAARKEELELEVEGRYTVENDPQNALVFHVDRLMFDGFELPDSTRAELERDFDLGFYPKKIVPFLEATEVLIEKGTMMIKLKISL